MLRETKAKCTARARDNANVAAKCREVIATKAIVKLRLPLGPLATRMRAMNYRIAIVIFALAAIARPAWADDAEGCKDPAWAPQRLPGFEISKCENKAWASNQVYLADGRKRLEGQLEVVTYELRDDTKDPASKVARDFYQAQAAKAGGTLQSKPDDIYSAYLVKHSPQGDVYMMWDHGGGNESSTGSYDVTTLKIGPPPQDVVAKPLKAPLTITDKCVDPPWLVKGMPGFKLSGCDNRDLDSVTFKTTDGEKQIAGRVLEVHYKLEDDSKNPVAALVERNFAVAL